MNIFCAIDLNKQEKAHLKKNVTLHEIIFKDEIGGNPVEAFFDCEICFGNIPSNWIEKSNKLKMLQMESVGFAAYLKLQVPNIPLITNLKGFFAIPVAETVIAGILTLFRGMDKFVQLKEKEEWQGADMRPSLRTLNNSTLLILGAGSMGLHLKGLLESFNCKILLYDKYNTNADSTDISNLQTILPSMDIIVNCLPDTQETKHLLNKERLKLLNENAIVVNVGRSPTIDEDALINCLKEKRIAGAVLDVTNKEPIPQNHPLWKVPNVILTQHTGGGYRDEILDKVDLFLENLKHFEEGSELQNVVDIAKGY
jgi:glyoxylate/hydroxypyruvate reductase A